MKLSLRVRPSSIALVILCGFIGGLPIAGGQETYTPTPENLKARTWFQDAKFGLFVHWGAYSVLGKGEWVMNNDKMTVADYERVAARFDPVNFDPAAWVSLAKSAGMRYI